MVDWLVLVLAASSLAARRSRCTLYDVMVNTSFTIVVTNVIVAAPSRQWERLPVSTSRAAVQSGLSYASVACASLGAGAFAHRQD